jgi:hypothetical protein
MTTSNDESHRDRGNKNVSLLPSRVPSKAAWPRDSISASIESIRWSRGTKTRLLRRNFELDRSRYVSRATSAIKCKLSCLYYWYWAFYGHRVNGQRLSRKSHGVEYGISMIDTIR